MKEQRRFEQNNFPIEAVFNHLFPGCDYGLLPPISFSTLPCILCRPREGIYIPELSDALNLGRSWALRIPLSLDKISILPEIKNVTPCNPHAATLPDILIPGEKFGGFGTIKLNCLKPGLDMVEETLALIQGVNFANNPFTKQRVIDTVGVLLHNKPSALIYFTEGKDGFKKRKRLVPLPQQIILKPAQV